MDPHELNRRISAKLTAIGRKHPTAAVRVIKVIDDDGTAVRLICGGLWGKIGPVDGIAAEPSYFDVSVPASRKKSIPIETTRNAFAYVFAGSGKFQNASDPRTVRTESVGQLAQATPAQEADNRSLVVFDRGDEVTVQAGEQGIRFLLVSGKPIEEPVAWHGPIVMNTQAELRQAFAELEDGTFLETD